MGKLEALQKKIDQVADKVRNLRYIFLTLLSALTGLVFGISQNKIDENLMINIFLIAGAGLVSFTGILITKEEKKRDILIDKLEKED